MLWKQFCASFLVSAFIVSSPVSLLADDKLPNYARVPDFKFTERSGKEIKLADLKGNVWIADFIFTRCQGTCPLLTGQMAGLQEKLAPSDIKLVSFSVDPEHDTPRVLSEYASRYHAQENKWFFLTGPKNEIWNFVTDGFSLGVSKPTPEDLKAGAEPVIHSNRFVLVDRGSNIRGYYDGSEASAVQKLIEDALQLTSSLRGAERRSNP